MTILSLENVSLHLANMNRPILKNICYKMKQGDFVVLLGSNGSGKSSLLKLLYQHYKPTIGSIYLMDQLLSNYAGKTFRKHVRVLTQNCNDSLFTSLTVYENYLLAKFHRMTLRVNHKTEKNFLGGYLENFNPNLCNKLNTLVNTLSGGEKQALALALSLLDPPDLLLLDEHTSALDPKTSACIMQLTSENIAKHHITCILTTHNLDDASLYGNRLLMLRDGEIVLEANENQKKSLTKHALTANYY